MSSMIQAPPPQIRIGGVQGAQGGSGAPGAFSLPAPGPPGPGPGGLGAGPGGPSGGSDAGPGDPDAGDVASKLRKALALVQSAAQQEKDDADASSITAIAASIHKAIANETGLADKVMGGGDGAKMIRKAMP